MIDEHCDVRSGYVNINSGRLRYSGLGGYGWSSRANSSDLRNAYRLSFDTSGVAPSNDLSRWNGFPLRCLARQ